MNRAKILMAAGTTAVSCMVLASCNGEPKNEESAPPPVTTVPSADTVVHRAKFSSAAGQAWLNSKDNMIKIHFDDAELAWANVAGHTYRIVEAGCMDDTGAAEHCHLEVEKQGAGLYVPERTLEVTKGSVANTYNIELRTKGDNNDTEFMDCKGVQEDSQNDQYISGLCDIYPVSYANRNPNHNFCAHTQRDDGKVAIYYRFTHGPCIISSGEAHNGNGHTE